MAAVAAVGLALSVAQTLFSALQTQDVRELCSMFGRESELVKLKDTMNIVKAVLLNVEFKRQGLTDDDAKVWVEKLKDAVYDFDDLLDEFNTVAQQAKQDARLTQKVKRFFSSKNNFLRSFKVYQEIKLLREKLDAIAKNRIDFGISIDLSQPVNVREETCSVISELEVIGREDDKKTIVNMLLSGQDQPTYQNVYVSIVGVGGLGKTTLAQLVYNDESVKRAFKNRIWVCVSDNDKEFKINEILGKMLGIKDVSHRTLESLQHEARTLLEKEKYLLVLDDVWNENPVEWDMLKRFFFSNGSGSKIIVTTRSKEVASSIREDSTIYELNGLSEENSWSLFKRFAFGKREDQVNTDLVEIGEGIVKKCRNIPLSIKVTASLLYGQDKSKWQLFRDSELAKLWRGRKDSKEDDSVMSTLMFSYYNLPPELKSCFSICSLFPKDYDIPKELLIDLWLALGFLVGTQNGQSMEDVGKRYFTILLNRCFFQDIQLDEHGEVSSCKMHDLMHDLAVEVAGEESSIINSANENLLRNKIRHISMYNSLESKLCISNALRTFIGLPSLEDVNAILSKGRRLRVLHLSRLKHATLPDSFGKLLHLRYLDLSFNKELEMVPKSITKLHNLQILKLTRCTKLKELPEETSKLVNLRTLDIDGCDSLTHMPRGMYNLKNLHTLPEFVVGGVDSKQVQGSKLVDLQALTSLKGDLCIRFRHFKSCNMPRATETALKLKDAHKLEIIWDSFVADLTEVHETLAEQVCPNDDIGIIKMEGYQGMKMPSWASMLVSVKVSSVKGLQYVTSSLSQLCHLKVVELKYLYNVEYIESDSAWELVSRPNDNNESKKVVFFPALEKLVLKGMLKLKGWWREVRWEEMDGCLADDGNGNGGIQEHATVTLPCFPRLRELHIDHCDKMMYFPPCPYVKQLHLVHVNEALTFCNKKGRIVGSGMTSISRPFSSDSNSDGLWYLEKLTVDDERVMMNSVLKEFVGGVIDMDLRFVGSYGRRELVKEGFERCASSLQHLSVKSIERLREIIQQLNNLQSLQIGDYQSWDGVDEKYEDQEEMPWKNLQSLSSLKFYHCKTMGRLPKGLRFLTSLRSLYIKYCDNFEALPESLQFLTSLQLLSVECCFKLKSSLPEAMRHLTSLKILDISCCSDELNERCQKPDGEDWPKICHIPNIIIKRFKTAWWDIRECPATSTQNISHGFNSYLIEWDNISMHYHRRLN